MLGTGALNLYMKLTIMKQWKWKNCTVGPMAS